MTRVDRDRRRFLKTTAAAAVVTSVPGLVFADQATDEPNWFSKPGRVVRVHHPGAMETMKKPNAEVVASMVERAVMELTGAKDPASAWKQFVGPKDVVEIKINCLGKRYNSTNAETVQAIITGLVSAGVDRNEIYIYDMYGSHMRSTREKLFRPDGKRVGFAEQWGYDRNATKHGAGKSKFAAILGKVTAVINVPVMKSHSLSQVTGALKNMTHGHVHNPSRFHRNGCVPGIPEIYAHPKIVGKVRLTIMDGLRLLYHGGPQDSPRHRIIQNHIYASTDPVALDRILFERIQEARKEHKKRPLEEPAFLAPAQELGLGVADRSKIDLVEVDLA